MLCLVCNGTGKNEHSSNSICNRCAGTGTAVGSFEINSYLNERGDKVNSMIMEKLAKIIKILEDKKGKWM